ncbi:MAG: hypothetical protein H6598_08740 [Flavobacteriales bacterium]|nr:hypothetical protein [Flavobacteriales bacterium]
MTENANIKPSGKKITLTKLYTNYNIGLLSMIVGLSMPFILPILGGFIFPVLMLGGLIAIIISDKKILTKLITILVIVVPLILLWDWYALLVFEFTDGINQPSH